MKILKIKLVHGKDFSNYLKNEIINLSVIAETSDVGEVNVTGYENCNIFSLDRDNFFIISNSNNGDRIQIFSKSEGSGIIKAIFSYGGETFYVSKQFLCHDSFFKDNYLLYLIPTLDAQNINDNVFVKSILDTLMEMLDILYAYNEDLKIISNFRFGKSKFISLLAQNVGFERIDFTQLNSKYEFTNDETFREVISNIFDLLSIRGTKLAYELFFNALGYITKIEEFWYDENGDLIEINSDDESSSTFYAYKTTGELIDNPPIARKDPRKNNNLLSNVNYTNTNYIRVLNEDGSINYQIKGDINLQIKNNNYDVNVFKNNKSNYMKLTFINSINSNFFEDPQDFSIEKKILIRRYLEFLRPSHIQYILETFQQDMPIDSFDVSSLLTDELLISELFEFKNYLNDVLFNEINGFIDDTDFNVGDVNNFIEDLSYNNKWDTLLKFDQNNLFDFKNLVIENFTAEII